MKNHTSTLSDIELDAVVTNSEMGLLTDAELESISGGHILGDIGRLIVHLFQGNGDQRRPTH